MAKTYHLNSRCKESEEKMETRFKKIDGFAPFEFTITFEYNPKEIETLISIHVPELKTVPMIEVKSVDTVEELNNYIKNRIWGIKSRLNLDMIMEGVVVRTANQNSTRFKSFKYINPEFLVKYGE